MLILSGVDKFTLDTVMPFCATDRTVEGVLVHLVGVFGAGISGFLHIFVSVVVDVTMIIRSRAVVMDILVESVLETTEIDGPLVFVADRATPDDDVVVFLEIFPDYDDAKDGTDDWDQQRTGKDIRNTDEEPEEFREAHEPVRQILVVEHVPDEPVHIFPVPEPA